MAKPKGSILEEAEKWWRENSSTNQERHNEPRLEIVQRENHAEPTSEAPPRRRTCESRPRRAPQRRR